MQKKRMLITGVSGLLGNNLAFCLRGDYDILGVYHNHRIEMDGIQTVRADLTCHEEVRRLVKEYEPEVVVHCAAQADVDICEENPEQAERINVGGTKNLMCSLNGYQTKVVYISTDLVYDGTDGTLSEDSPIHPLNSYGMTKLDAEQEVLNRKNVLILRTNFFGWNILDKFSLGEWVIHELTQKREMYGFTDCTFSSIYTFELAKILDLALKKDLTGIYNCASSSSMSKFEFVSKIASRLNLEKAMIKPISIEQFGFKAKRCKNLNLNTSKLSRDLSIDIPPIEFSIERFVEDSKAGIPKIIKSHRYYENTYPKTSNIISYGCQCIDEEDIAAVVEVLRSETITQGPKSREFESALCQTTHAPFGVVVNSGTSALHIACLAAGIGCGDEVITSANTFVASANCVVYCGGKPVFADIDARTYNISLDEIEKKINKRTKAIIPVHFAGQSCDMEAIRDIVRFYENTYGHKIYIIEDACHALGSSYKRTKVGSCAFSDMAVLSFHPVKHITTCEGGAILTGDKKLWRKLSYFRSHGITSDPDEFIYRENAFDIRENAGDEPVKNPWYYEQNCLGYNYRITEIQCALGISQLKKLNRFSQRRREIIRHYNEAFKVIEWLIVPYEEEFCDTNFHLYVLQFDFEKMGTTRAQVMIALKKEGIQTQVHYIPVYLQPYYREKFGTKIGDCPRVERYYQKCLSIPLHPAMTDKEVEKVIWGIKKIKSVSP